LVRRLGGRIGVAAAIPTTVVTLRRLVPKQIATHLFLASTPVRTLRTGCGLAAGDFPADFGAKPCFCLLPDGFSV